ncbi:Protein translocase subunit SecD [Asticcacaulis sp. MM231]|uniref:protein translocase subunit SecD n=1 Tax=Asticcacaulis sp. MM231 TaxID=3157666 RepID=UPI0032D58C2A
MMNLSRWKVGLVIGAILLGILFAVPNFLPASVRDQVKGFMPTQTLNLGLDLQGGSYLLMEVDTNDLIKTKIAAVSDDVRARLDEKGIAYTGVVANGTSVSVRITDASRLQEAQATLVKLGTPLPKNPGVMDLAVQQGSDQTLLVIFTQEGIRSTSAGAVETSIEVIRKRIDALGTKEPSISRQGINRIVIEAPGESDPEQLKRLIGRTAKLTFQMVDETVSPSDLAAGRVPPGSEVLPDDSRGGTPLVVRKAILVSGNNLTKANVGVDEYQRPAIDFAFNSEGAKKFGDATSRNLGKRFAIILDGHIVSAPVIQGAITTGSGQITGGFSHEEASEIVNILKSGALPAKLNFESQRTVGAELGADAVHAGVVSTIIGFLTIVVFMFLAYGFIFGGVSIAALLVNLLLIMAAMTAFQATLTLPGIAGLILSLAVAVDANVLIYERIRDEERSGHRPIAAMDVGFARALVSILDANITNLISALIMFVFGAGPVRGFAWTLMIGVFTSVFSAILVSQILLGWWYKAAKPKKLPI